MGLKADVDEVTSYWNRAPWRVRIVLILVLFISSTSFASLSESVIKWRGFLLDALNFYRAHVLRPLAEAAQNLVGHPLSTTFLDNAVLYGVFFAALTRARLLRNSSKLEKARHVFFMGALYVGMLLHLSGLRDSPGATTIWVMYPLFLFTAYFITKGAERLLAMVYMLAPVLLVGVLAALSEGLSK
jgi:hypothetical protein